MSQTNYISNLLNIKDPNIIFNENIEDVVIKKRTCKVINATLSYIPDNCPKCSKKLNDRTAYEKKGFKSSLIKVPTIFKMTTYIKLRKQRITCKHCNSSFTCSTPLINPNCFISNITKLSIVEDLTKKFSEKDIAINNNVSPNTVQRIIDSYYKPLKLHKNYLPEALSFDEFKSVKSADGAMSFQICNAKNGKIIDIVEDRRLDNLIKYFNYYTHKARSRVKYIVIDMYTPYVTLITKMFPNAKIVIDNFHLIQLVSKSMNKTRIKVMNSNKKYYNKLKRYWKLILKSENELNIDRYNRYTCFNELITQATVVERITNVTEEMKETYNIYQDILASIKNKNYNELMKILKNTKESISDYMKTSIKTLINYLPHIQHTFSTTYTNGYIEGNNNFIKALKRIAFGFRSFRRFKARILICKGLINPTKKEA